MEYAEFLGVLGSFVLAIVGAYGAIRLINLGTRRLSDRGTSGETAQELEELRTRIQELETVRMVELEERVDFTERLLAQAQDPARLQSGPER